MLTEYSSYDDIRKFRDKAIEKLAEMRNGWLGKKIDRWRTKIHQEQIANYNNIQEITFVVDHQKMIFTITPAVDSETKRVSNKAICSILHTEVETKSGKKIITFSNGGGMSPKKNGLIVIQTPHATKRFKERCIGWNGTMPDLTDVVKYTRNGTDYELHICFDGVFVTRKIADDIIMYITFLHRNMCTSKNYQELFERAGKAIDEHDIYEWK